MRVGAAGFWAAIVVVVVGCTPALDWRDVRPEGSDLTMLFPCRPDRQERRVQIGAAVSTMRMDTCRASGMLFSLAFVDATDAAAVGPTLATLRASAAANIGAVTTVQRLDIAGATPNAESALVRMQGRLADGRTRTERAAFFAHGMRVYQAAMLGESLPDDTAETFFGAIKVRP